MISWQHIQNDTSEVYLARKATPGFEASSCLQWFYDSFYDRLFDVHPAARPLFKNSMIVQGKALVHMISAALSLLDNLPNLVSALQNLAKTHSLKGVLAVQYGIVGEVLLWTLTLCLGGQFDSATSLTWVKIYSVMLSVIIPIAIEEEKNLIEAVRKAEVSGRRSGRIATST